MVDLPQAIHPRETRPSSILGHFAGQSTPGIIGEKIQAKLAPWATLAGAEKSALPSRAQLTPSVGVVAISATVDASRTFMSLSSVSKTGPVPA
jgi:hypothetical protein